MQRADDCRTCAPSEFVDRANIAPARFGAEASELAVLFVVICRDVWMKRTGVQIYE